VNAGIGDPSITSATKTGLPVCTNHKGRPYHGGRGELLLLTRNAEYTCNEMCLEIVPLARSQYCPACGMKWPRAKDEMAGLKRWGKSAED